MADAYVNFFARLDPRGAQAYQEGANQPHRAAAAVGASAALATEIALVGGTFYCEVGPTSGDVFACIASDTVNEATITAKRIRIREGTEKTLCMNGSGNGGNALYLWAV